MRATPANLASTRWANTGLITLFMVMLWLPTFDTLFHIDHSTLPRENRILAQFPEFKPAPRGLKEYIASLEAYFNDHFGCRSQLIHWHRRLESGGVPWKQGRNAPGVIVGHNGWLFLAPPGGAIEYSREVRQFSPQELHDWQILLEHRRDWLAQLGIKYVFVVAPDKQTIYSDQLPAGLDKAQPDVKLDQFVAYMHVQSTVEVLDLRPALRAVRQIAPTYYKTDHHWNFFGGFVGYQEIVKLLSKRSPGLEPLPLVSFNLKREPVPSGYLADWADLDVNETCAVYLTPKSDLSPLEMSSRPRNYAGQPVGFTLNPKAQGSIVVFGDSFKDYLSPFLGYHFNKATYINQYALSEKWVEQEKPDVVISEMWEQAFNASIPTGFDEPGDYLMRHYLYPSPTQ